MNEIINPVITTQKQQPVIYSNFSSFPFADVLWNRPTHVLGEPNNFIILSHMKQRGVPIYVETPECSVLYAKKGESDRVNPNPLVKIGKKYFLDFLLSDVEWLSWLEHLEELGHQRLLSNQTEWFQTEMTEEDMENLFVSPFKMVKGKGGKQFSMRTTFPLDKTLKIFDEKRQQVDYDLDNLGSIITEETRFKAIVELVGIKCSPRNFHLEMEIKQMMILRENPVFVECLISPPVFANLEKTVVEENCTQEISKTEPTPPSPVELPVISSDTEPEPEIEIEKTDQEITNLLYNDIIDFETITGGEPKEEKTEKERAIEKMKNIRVLGMTNFLKKRGYSGENILLKILS